MIVDDIGAEVEDIKNELCNETSGCNFTFVDYILANGLTQELKNKALAINIRYLMDPAPESRQQIQQQMLSLLDDLVAQQNDEKTLTSYETQMGEMLEAEQELYRSMTTQHSKPVYSCQNLTAVYTSGFQLSDIDLDCYAGEITAVVGKNGNGKTTLFKVIAGLLKHSDGEFCYDFDAKFTSNNKIPWAKVKQNIGYVPQELPTWYGSLRDNLEYEAAIHGILGKHNRQQVDFIISRLGLIDHMEKSWNELSGGFKFRFELAKALVWKPKLLILDEPLANLDIVAQLIVLKDLRNLADSASDPVSIILSSQHLHEIEVISDRLLYLEKGKPLFNDDTRKLGNNFDSNLFEIECNANRKELIEFFSEIPSVRIDTDGLWYTINTPRSVSIAEVLSNLVKHDVTVTYFRDLSSSVKRLF